MPSNYLFRMINMDSTPCGLLYTWMIEIRVGPNPEMLLCLLNHQDCNLAWIMNCSCLPELCLVKVLRPCYTEITKKWENWLIMYLKRHRGLVQRLELAQPQKQLDTHLWRIEWHNGPQHLQVLCTSNRWHCPGLGWCMFGTKHMWPDKIINYPARQKQGGLRDAC